MRHHQVPVHVHKNLLVVLSAILLAITFGGAARLGAQSLAGSLTGLISDPSGAVIVGADVVLMDVDKGYKYASVTSAEGRYTFRDLSPGNYKLNVTKQGFESLSLSGILIEVNENTSRNVALTVGSASEVVNVTTEASLLQTEDATLGLVVDRQFVNDLPLVGRDITSLAYLTPGVTVPQGGTLQATGGNDGNDLNFVSDGQRNATAALFVDGVTTSQGDPNPGVVRPLYVPSPDAVAEFKVEQGVIRADSGFSGGTIVNIVTRSGSNQFHGTVYDFDQNNSFNANSYSNNEYGVKNQPSNTNTFGAVAGGPIKKDKTFFFAVFNGYRSRSASSSLAWVPSTAERAGDFGEICQSGFDGNGLCQDVNPVANFGQLWDPYTATTYNGGDVLPQKFIPYNNLAKYVSPGPNPLENGPITLPAGAGNVIDPSAKIVMNTAFPMPNIPGAAENAVNYYSVTHGYGANNEVDLRLDQRFTTSDNLAVKFAYAWANSKSPGCLPGVWDPCSNGPNTGHTYHLTLNYSRPLNSHMLLQLQGGVIGNVSISPGIVASEYPGFDPVTSLGMPSYINSTGYKAAPYIQYAGPGLGAVGSKTYAIGNFGFTTLQMGGSFDITKGKHEIKAGGDWKFVFERFEEPGVPAGAYGFSNVGTAQDETTGTGGGNSLASLMIGSPLNNASYSDLLQLNTSQPDYDLFVQDTWRISGKLTLDLGLRYEIQVPETEANNDIQWFDPNAPSPYASYLPGLKGAIDFASGSGERRPIDTSFNNIQPRVGFAYKVNSSTVVRGGYGIYYSPSIGAASGGTSGNSAGSNSYTSFPEYLFNGIPGSDGATPAERFSNPFPGGILEPPIDDPSPLAFAGLGNMDIAVRDPQVPYSQTFTLGVQHDLPMKSVLTVYYVGTKGTHLYTQQSPPLDPLPISVEANTPAQNEALNNGVTPNPFYGAPTVQGCMGGNFFCQSTVPNWYLDVPFPQYIGFGTGNTTFTHSWYHSLQATFQKRLTHGLEGHASYTWSKSIDDGSSTGGGSAYLDPPGDEQGPIDPNRIYLEKSLSGFDIPQNLTFAYTYALPFGRGRDYGSSVNRFVDAVLGGWNTSGMWAFQSGFPLAFAQQTGTPIPTYWHRPTITGVLKKSSSFKKPGDNYFPANWNTIIGPSPSFVVPLDEAPRYEGSVRAPGINTASLGVFKSFNLNALREGARFEFRVEAFNAFNHPQFPGPVPTVDGGNFGVVYAEQVNSPRQVQFGGKIYF